jgi:methionine aminotransferase
MSKLPNTGTSIFAVMTAIAAEYKAINLSQGFPNFNPPSKLIDLVYHFMKSGENQYAPMTGTYQVRNSIANKIKKYSGANYDVNEEITLTAGGTQALFTAITSFVGKDDEVILFEPAYDSYLPSVILNGGIPVPVQLKGNDFHIDWNEVNDKISPMTKMIIINSPHNPSGSVLNEKDISALKYIVEKHNIIILSDEVYEHIIFDGREHHSVTKYPELAAKSIVVYSFGKTYHTTGWKMGYVLAPKNLMSEFRKVHQFNVFTVNTPVQLAFAEMMKDEEHFLSLSNFYQEKRDYFLRIIKNSEFTFEPSSGTYFQLLDYSTISDENDSDFSVRLVKEFGVAVIPLTPFYSMPNDRKLIRICFAKTNDVLEQAAEKLMKVK